MDIKLFINFVSEMNDYLNSLNHSNLNEKLRLDRKNILYHDEMYYGKCEPVIEDSMYDHLVREYRNLYNNIKNQLDDIENRVLEFSKNIDEIYKNDELYLNLCKNINTFKKYLKEMELKVGSSSISDVIYKKAIHKVPMMSLDNTYNLDEITSFMEDLTHEITKCKNFKEDDDIKFVIEYKIDGLSCDLFYNKGKLVQALTRGDGKEGEVITHKVTDIEGVPFEIDYQEPIHIRGEILIKYHNWEKSVFKELSYKNPRNAAAGIIRMKGDHLNGFLSFISYEIVMDDNNENNHFETHLDKLKFLTALGKDSNFELPVYYTVDVKDYLYLKFDSKVTNKIEEIINKEYERLCGMIGSKDYPTDGLVFKLNNTKFYEEIGYTSKFPKYHIAYKFKDLEYTSRVKDIIWQVGRTGRVTPVVEIEPVEIDGSTISRVTAHNIEQMVRLGNIAIGKDVVIVKSAMVIPKILRVKDYPIDSVICDPIDLSKIEYPKKCPSCGSELILEGPDLICTNSNCRDKNIQKLSFYSSRNCMNIEGLSVGIITTLYDKGVMKSIEDIYNLKEHKTDLIKIPGFGLKSINKLLNSIEKSKDNHPYRLIGGLGYSNIGLVMSKALLEAFNNDLNELNGKTKDDIMNSNISNVGDVISKSIEKLLSDLPNILNFCKKYGLKTKFEDSLNSNKLLNKVFVFTGKLKQHSRKYYEDLVKSHGATVTSNVNKNTTFLIMGDNPTEHKVSLAKTLNKEIFTEEMFLDQIKELIK